MQIFGLTITWTFDLILFILFLIALSVLLYFKKKELVVQKILHPFIYIIMYRTKLGLALMDKLASKYRGAVQLFGYVSVGVGFLGMLYVSLGILTFFIKLIFQPTVDTNGVSLVLPFTHIPGIGYLSFTHWILAIFILAIVHEFSHGVVARSHHIPVKSSGFAVFALLAPVIPAAFVEPDEKKLGKAHDIVQYSVFAAGPMANLVLAFILLFAFPYVGDMTNSTLAPFEDTITHPIGFSYEVLENESYPAYTSAVPPAILSSINGKPVDDYSQFMSYSSCLLPDQEVTLGTDKGEYTFTAIPRSDNPEKGFMGIKPTQNERRINTEYAGIAGVYYWFRGFI